jgi:RsiW-degrading membrane proteinase PrsW (M82 family)
MADLTAALALALAPVMCLLALLILMDSFKLVTARFVFQAIGAGMVAAGVALAVNLWLIDGLALPIPVVTRAIAPITEELLKLGFVVYAIASRRVGFPVDAAIVGFAVGAGFALVENAYYLMAMPTAGVWLWLARGFGAAILHGATTAIAAIIAQSLAGRRAGAGCRCSSRVRSRR